MRLDDLVAGRIEAVDWIMLDEAQEVKRQLGDKAYKQWIEYVLKNSKRKLVVVFRTLSNGHWTYGDGKRKAWIPWMDIKPYITNVDVRITSQIAEWKGAAIVEFMRQNLLGAPKLIWAEFNITYTTGQVDDSQYDKNGEPDWKRGLKYHVEDICVKLWKCRKMGLVSFNNRQRTDAFGRETRWYESWRDQFGWGGWEEVER